jgi:hypothetical protein
MLAAARQVVAHSKARARRTRRVLSKRGYEA